MAISAYSICQSNLHNALYLKPLDISQYNNNGNNKQCKT